MIKIIPVQNTNEIPTAHQENYVLVDARTEQAALDWINYFVSLTGKVIGHVYRFGDHTYYAEVTA